MRSLFQNSRKIHFGFSQLNCYESKLFSFELLFCPKCKIIIVCGWLKKPICNPGEWLSAKIKRGQKKKKKIKSLNKPLQMATVTAAITHHLYNNVLKCKQTRTSVQWFWSNETRRYRAQSAQQMFVFLIKWMIAIFATVTFSSVCLWIGIRHAVYDIQYKARA